MLVGSSRLHLLISGAVQGVFFRTTARKKAQELGLTGYVRNLEDGRVEIFAEGERSHLAALAQWCYHGTRAARVDNVEEEWSDASGEFDGFSIR